jgi:uncharacterized protein (DUF4415 family)
MAKASRSANGKSKSRQASTVKARSHPASAHAASTHAAPTHAVSAKSSAQPRPLADTGRTDWAADLVFDVREPKLAVSLRLDADVLRFFRGFGAGYQTRINEVLKAFMQARGEAGSVGHAVISARASRASAGNGKRASR